MASATINFGERIRQERERLGLSIGAFASKMGVHRNTQARYESGDRIPDASYLARLVLEGANLDFVLEESPNKLLGAYSKAVDLAEASLLNSLLSDLDFEGFRRDSEALASVSGVPGFVERRPILLALIARCPSLSAVVMEMSSPDLQLLSMAIEGLESALQERGIELPPRNKAAAITLLYRSAMHSKLIDPRAIEEAIAAAT